MVGEAEEAQGQQPDKIVIKDPLGVTWGDVQEMRKTDPNGAEELLNKVGGLEKSQYPEKAVTFVKAIDSYCREKRNSGFAPVQLQTTIINEGDQGTTYEFYLVPSYPHMTLRELKNVTDSVSSKAAVIENIKVRPPTPRAD